MEEHYKQVVSDVKQYGWHVILVMEEDNAPPFAYSVGLYHSFNHPEIIMFGLSLETMHTILNILGEQIQTGTTFIAGREYDNILENYRCAFRIVSGEWYPEYLGVACWFYKNVDFPVIQCFWPSKLHRFPWDVEAEEQWRTRQPILE
jgi:hypothetical protein